LWLLAAVVVDGQVHLVLVEVEVLAVFCLV
jgi:hypothetical protein